MDGNSQFRLGGSYLENRHTKNLGSKVLNFFTSFLNINNTVAIRILLALTPNEKFLSDTEVS